jgi:hypothetical protein
LKGAGSGGAKRKAKVVQSIYIYMIVGGVGGVGGISRCSRLPSRVFRVGQTAASEDPQLAPLLRQYIPTHNIHQHGE